MAADISPQWDFVTMHMGEWKKLFGHMVGCPVTMLEIGSLEGNSAVWWIENILTHDNSRLWCIDPWVWDCSIEKRFDANIVASGNSHKVIKLKGISRHWLHTIKDASLDAAYIDGDHEARSVLTDALLILPLLKIGGILLFDDYEWDGIYRSICPFGRWNGHILPRVGIDAFLTVAEWQIEVIHKGYQLAVRRLV